MTNQIETNAPQKTISLSRKIILFALKYGTYLVFLALCIGIAITSPVFFDLKNFSNILLQTSAIGIIAVGMTFVILTGGIDVSVGATVALASAVGIAAFKVNNQPWYIGVLLFFVVAGIIGFINGFSTARLGMPAFLVTLATQTMARGFVLSLSGGRWLYDLPSFFQTIGLGYIGPIPNSVLIMLVSFLLGHLILSKTVFGRQVYAVGGNPDAAQVSGINTKRTILLTYVICGLFAGLSSLVLTSRLNSFTASMGTGYEFSAIAAAVIGGTSLVGGEGSMAGTLIGVLIIGVINNALNLMGVSAFYQDVARWAIIFTAVLLDALRNRFAYLSEE